jgi:hypothetical protein
MHLHHLSSFWGEVHYTDLVTNLEEWEEQERGISSPVEQLFYIEWSFRKFCDSELKDAFLEPQYKDKSTGKYRIDFMIDFVQEAYSEDAGRGLEYHNIVLQTEPPKLGVEIDSHEWHERTKQQAQYDKERERFLISNGWKILRFTGSEVYNNPAKCVEEAIQVREKLATKYLKKIRDLAKKKKGRG